MKLKINDAEVAWHIIVQYLLAHDGNFQTITGLKYRAIVHENCILVDEKNELGYPIDKISFFTSFENIIDFPDINISGKEEFVYTKENRMSLYFIGLLNTCQLLEKDI